MSEATRNRSAEAWRAVVASGLIQKRAAQVYDIHYRYGSLSRRQMFEHFKREHPSSIAEVVSFSPRYAQLVRAGLLIETGECLCDYTNQTVTMWDVTDKIPTERLVTPRGDDPRDRQIADLKQELFEAKGTIGRLQEALASKGQTNQVELFGSLVEIGPLVGGASGRQP